MMKKLMMYLLLLFGLFQITAQEIASIANGIVEIKDNRNSSFIYYRPTNIFTNPYLFSDSFNVEPIPVEYYTEKEKEIQKKLNDQEEGIITFSGGELFYERDIDNEDITPYTWKWVHLQVKEENGGYTNIHLRRPNWWFTENNATNVGDKVYVSLPQIGIDGEIPIVKIYPNTLDTRFWDYYYDESHVKRPITGKIDHSANNVVNIKFNDSEKIISPTTNHLLWSADREGWVSVGELVIGEHITTKEGILTLASKEPNEGWHVVYDLEVYRDHNFLVGDHYVLAHNCEVNFNKKKANGIYNVYDSNNVLIYNGKGGQARARLSMRKREGGKVVHYEITEGIANQDLHKSAYILEYLDMGDEVKGKNKVMSPGKKYYEGLSSSQKKTFDNFYEKLKELGGKDITPQKKKGG